MGSWTHGEADKHIEDQELQLQEWEKCRCDLHFVDTDRRFSQPHQDDISSKIKVPVLLETGPHLTTYLHYHW